MGLKNPSYFKRIITSSLFMFHDEYLLVQKRFHNNIYIVDPCAPNAPTTTLSAGGFAVAIEPSVCRRSLPFPREKLPR